MRKRTSLVPASLVTALLALTSLAARESYAQQPAPAATPWAAVEAALGRKGTMQPGGVIKFGFPRSDLSVTADGVQLESAFALGGWVALEAIGRNQAMVMGDLVLTEEEVGPVMRALQAGGIQQTALHNHLLHESPRVMYMHVSAHGDPASLARAIHDALARSATPIGAASAPRAPSATGLDTAAIARALGFSGKLNGVVYQVAVPRRETIREMGHDVPPAMGVATAINFQPTGKGRAAVTGDFVMRASEVNAVIRALQQGGITVTALHSHMLDESPRLFFMHFWGNDDAVALARTLRAALDRTNLRSTAAYLGGSGTPR